MVKKVKEIASKVWNIINGKDVDMDGEVDIDDAMEAYWLTATKGRIGEIYNICGKKVISVSVDLDNPSQCLNL